MYETPRATQLTHHKTERFLRRTKRETEAPRSNCFRKGDEVTPESSHTLWQNRPHPSQACVDLAGNPDAEESAFKPAPNGTLAFSSFSQEETALAHGRMHGLKPDGSANRPASAMLLGQDIARVPTGR